MRCGSRRWRSISNPTSTQRFATSSMPLSSAARAKAARLRTSEAWQRSSSLAEQMSTSRVARSHLCCRGLRILADVTISPGGVGRNMAENLARLDVDVALVSMVGDDANGQLVRAATAKCGVDVSMIGTGSAPTGTYLAVLDGSGEMVTAVNDMRVIDDLSPGFLAQHEGRLAAADLLVADCNLPVSSLAWLASLSARAGRRLLIDPISVPKSRKLLALRLEAPLFALMANRLQIESLTGQSELEAGGKTTAQDGL